MGSDDHDETRAAVARRRLAQLAAAFDAELPAAEDDPAPEPSARRIVPTHLRVVATVAVAACVLLGWYLFAQRPHSSDPVAPVGFASSGPAATPSAASAELVVDVVGKVKHPGIVTLPRGARVHDAIEAAGGVRGKVDPTTLNMARPVADGEQIVVGAPGGPGGGAAPGAPAKVNLNQASIEQLDELPGVGPVTAQAIVSWREQHGRFSSIDDLLDVKGIGDATLADLRDLVTV